MIDRKTSIVLLVAIVVVIIAIVSAFAIIDNHNSQKNNAVSNSTTNFTVANITNVTEDKVVKEDSGKYGYCAICGARLTFDEASEPYTEGKVCRSCDNNPYYYTEEGSKYANEKVLSVPTNPWVDDTEL